MQNRWIGLAVLTLHLGIPAIARATQASPPPVPATPARPVTEAPPAGQRLQFYGFIRQDAVVDDARTDSAQSPLFVLPEARNDPAQRTYTMHPRLTRFGVHITGPTVASLGGAELAGNLEIDFQNGGRDSRAVPRYRHAYLRLTWQSTTLLVGQTWDLISPLFPSVNADTLMWNAGNLGDRRPQVRATHQVITGRTQWSLAAALALTGAVDQQDLDADGIRDGEAAFPTLQTRASVSHPLGARRLAVGVWAHRSQQELATSIAGETNFSSHAVGMDLEVPLGSRLIARGEVWTGRNLGDVRGGIGQSINRATGTEIESTGGWLEVGGDITPRHALFAGYTIDAPTRDQLPAGGRARNGAWFVTNRLSAGKPVVFGVDYLRWRTSYRGLAAGTNHRFNLYVTYTF